LTSRLRWALVTIPGHLVPVGGIHFLDDGDAAASAYRNEGVILFDTSAAGPSVVYFAAWWAVRLLSPFTTMNSFSYCMRNNFHIPDSERNSWWWNRQAFDDARSSFFRGGDARNR